MEELNAAWIGVGGTIAGTILGFAGAVIVARRSSTIEARRTYEARLETALAELMMAIPRRVATLEEHDAMIADADRSAPNRNPDEDPPLPSPYELAAVMEAALMTARAEDVRTLKCAQEALYAIVALPSRAQRARLAQLAEMLRKWRHGDFGDVPWSHFFEVARQVEKRAGFTPPPPWEDRLRNVVTRIPQPTRGAVRRDEWRAELRDAWRRLSRRKSL